jgi:ribonuclease HI
MYQIYTDGAYSSNRNQQGFSYVVYKEIENVWCKTHLYYEGLLGGTNNRAEIYACIAALKYVKNNNITEEVTIFTDSMYVVGTVTKNWKKNKNTDLWGKLFSLLTPNVTFVHVKGHSTDDKNNLCDIWAVFASHMSGCRNDLIKD